MYFDLGFIIREIDPRVADIQGTRQVGGHRVQQRLHALVLVGGAQKNRRQIHRERPDSSGFVDQLLGDLLVEDRLGEIVREHGNRVEHRLPGRVSRILHRLGDILLDDILAVFSLEKQRLHGDQVNHTLKFRFQADGQLEQHRIVAQFLAELSSHLDGVRTRAIQLVDEGDAGNPVSLHLPIHSHGLGLHTRHAAENQHRAVEHA